MAQANSFIVAFTFFCCWVFQTSDARPANIFQPTFPKGRKQWAMDITTLTDKGHVRTDAAIAALEDRVKSQWNLTVSLARAFPVCIKRLPVC